MNNVICVCGCKLFTDFRPFTIDDDAFMVWNFKEKIVPAKLTIPIVKCVACGKLHAPKASFGGKNILDEEVQLYSELLKYIKAYNASIDLVHNTAGKVSELISYVKDLGCRCNEAANVNVKTTQISTEGTKNAVDPLGTGSRIGKGNKVKNT